MALACAVEGRDPDEAVNAPLGLEVSVGVRAVDLEGGGRDSSFFGFLVVGDGDFESLVFGPAGIHAIEHAGPVAGLGATGSGLNGDISVVGIGRSVEKGEELEGFEVLFEAGECFASFAGGIEIVELAGQFDAGIEVFEFLLELEERFETTFAELRFGQDFAGGFLVVPEFGVGGTGLELLDLRSEGRNVKDTF